MVLKKPISVWLCQVHLCEAYNMSNFVEEDYFMNRTIARPVLVAVKILRKNAEDRAR